MSDIAVPDGLNRPTVPLVGADGNAFAILGRVSSALREAGNSQEVVTNYREQATSGDYAHLLRVTVAFVHVRDEADDDFDVDWGDDV